MSLYVTSNRLLTASMDDAKRRIAIGPHPSNGNRREDLACYRRDSLFRADYLGVVDACEKHPCHILRQSRFWLDDCRLDRGNDVGNGRTK
jgi:hypothetical protein